MNSPYIDTIITHGATYRSPTKIFALLFFKTVVSFKIHDSIKAFLNKRNTECGGNASVYCFQKGFRKFKQKIYTRITLRCFLIGLFVFSFVIQFRYN